MFTRWLFSMAILVLLSGVAFAEDFWDSVFDESPRAEHSNHESNADDDGIFLPMNSLSFETHGAYFGSGNEFLLGGSHIMGLGGSRHSADHNINHPTHGVYPDVQHLFGNKVGFMGPLWGAPEGFEPDYGELDAEHSNGDSGANEGKRQRSRGLFNDDDWWSD